MVDVSYSSGIEYDVEFYEDFENYTDNTDSGMWNADFLTFSSDPDLVSPAATPKGMGVAVSGGSAKTSSLNLYVNEPCGHLMIESSIYIDGKWGIEAETSDGLRSRIEIPFLPENQWMDLSIQIDVYNESFVIKNGDTLLMSGGMYLSDINIIRFYTDYGKVIYDDICVSYPSRTDILELYAVNNGMPSSYDHNLFPSDTEAVAVCFTQKIDSASIINSVSLCKSDGTDVEAWTEVSDNMIYINPVGGFESDTDYAISVSGITSGFVKSDARYEVGFSISDTSLDFELANDNFDLWTAAEVDISDTVTGQVEGTGTMKWANWSLSDPGKITIENEDGRGKVLRICSDETLSQTTAKGLSVGLTAYTGSGYMKKVPTPGKVWVFSCDIKADKISNPSGVLIQTTTGKFINVIRLSYGLLTDGSGSVGKIYPDRWYNYTAVMDVKSGIYNTYLNGVLVKSSSTVGIEDNISQIRLYVDKVKGIKQTVCFDNFSFSEYDSVKDYITHNSSTALISDNASVQIGMGSLKNIITLTSDIDIQKLKSALSSYADANVCITTSDDSELTSGDKVTVTSKDGKNTAQYYISVNSGVTNPDFISDSIATSGYIRAECEYFGKTKPIIVAVAYDNNKVVSVGTLGEDSSSQKIPGYLSGGVNVTDTAKWTHIKVFVFDSVSNIKPMAENCILTFQKASETN